MSSRTDERPTTVGSERETRVAPRSSLRRVDAMADSRGDWKVPSTWQWEASERPGLGKRGEGFFYIEEAMESRWFQVSR